MRRNLYTLREEHKACKGRAEELRASAFCVYVYTDV